MYHSRSCHGADFSRFLQAVFHNFVDNIKDGLFEGTVDVLFGRLDSAAEAVGKALEDAFSALAQKVRPTSLSSSSPRSQRVCVLWWRRDVSRADGSSVVARLRSALPCCGRACATTPSKLRHARR